jgi:molecular chaperone GrpE
MVTDHTRDAADEAIADRDAWALPVGDEVPETAAPLQAELAELKDRLLRALAENENSRRRAEREREDAVRFAASQLVKDLLPAADSLSRALETLPPGDEALQKLLAGVALTEQTLQDAFAKHGIQKIKPDLGEPFDPHRHQALFEVESNDYPAGSVAEILVPGYSYHERLLRPALVGVAKSRIAETSDRPP